MLCCFVSVLVPLPKTKYSDVSKAFSLPNLELLTLKKGVLTITRGRRREGEQMAEALERAAALNIPEACARG